MGVTLTISVIIPTKNRHEDLFNTIKSVISQTCLPEELIIIDQNMSSEVKDALISAYENELKEKNITLKYIHDSQITGLTQARNRGIEKNESDIVLFLDDDVILERDFIFNMMEIYKKYPDIYGVSGVITNFRIGLVEYLIRKIFETGDFADRRSLIFTRLDKYKNAECISVSKLPGGLTSYRQEVFKDFKFDENFIKYGMGEDFDFSFRVSRKYKIVITPKAKLIHVESSLARLNHKKLIENELFLKYIFFRKNLDKNIGSYIRLIWVIAGYILSALLLAVFKQDASELKGIYNCFKKILKREDADFIKFYRME